MVEVFAAGAAAGALFGWFAHANRQTSAEKPMRLVMVHQTMAPGMPAKAADELGQWELYTVAFCWQASMVGSFSYRGLRDAGVIRRRGWEIYCDVLKAAGVIQASERSATWWAGGWSTARLRVELKHRAIAPPFPAGAPPALNSAWLAAQLAQHSAVGAAKGGA